MSDSDGKIYVDASQPATLHNGSNAVSCPTLQEAVLAWYRLPDDERKRATIVATHGQIYTAQEIVRLYYRRRVDGGALLNASPLNQSPLNQEERGDTLVGTLRKTYGPDFAPGARSHMRLDTLREREGGSLTKISKGK
jgi:hypothetical protein